MDFACAGMQNCCQRRSFRQKLLKRSTQIATLCTSNGLWRVQITPAMLPCDISTLSNKIFAFPLSVHSVIKFNYSIDELRDCSLSWSDIKSLESFHAKLDHFGVPIRSNDFTKELPSDSTAKCLQIRMSVVDSQNCRGPQTNATISLASNEHHHGIVSRKIEIKNVSNKGSRWLQQITLQLILICVVGAITTLIIIIVVVYVLLWKNRKKNIVNYWRELYHTVQHGWVRLIIEKLIKKVVHEANVVFVFPF